MKHAAEESIVAGSGGDGGGGGGVKPSLPPITINPAPRILRLSFPARLFQRCGLIYNPT